MYVTKRIISLVLTLVMLISLACTGMWTPHVHAEESSHLDDLTVVHVNPIYADTITAEDLEKPNHNLLYGDNTDDEYYYDVETAGEMIRDDLVARDTTIVVDIYGNYTSQETLQDDAIAMIYDVLAVAMKHTGNPVEGDYILWQYAGFEANMTDAYYDSNSSTLYMTLTFTMTYHANAAQEAEVNAAVTKLLGELNVSQKDDYTKLKAIYDYITSNVTYDHANKNNNDYKLKHSAYAALINKTAVCQGYALLLYRLALELGVDCRLIPGTASGEGHGWNIAKLGNHYYNLDSTWDAGLSQYQCFLVGSSNFPNHTRWDKPGELPTYDNYNSAEFHAAYPMSEYDYTVGCSHTYSDAITTNPTCTEKGVKTYTCTKCGDSYTEAVPSTGHNYDKTAVVAPTCSEKGYTTHVCSNCGDSYQDTFVAANGHTFDAGVITKEASCSEAGVKTYTCSVCAYSYTEDIAILDHVYDKTEVTAPTCTEEGYTTHTCTACGTSYQDTIVAALGHSYGEGVVTKAATCAEAGVMTYTCTVCNFSYTEDIAILDHVYDKTEVTAPTCTEEGYTTYTCTACGTSYQDTPVAATGHTYDSGTITTAPTCSAKGEKTYACINCSDTFTENLDALGHAYDDGVITTEPTCTESGIRTHTCARCGSTIKANEEPLGHTPDAGVVTKVPTCLETGIMTYNCTVCNETFTEELPYGSHNYQGGICIVCGDIMLVAPEILSCYSTQQTSVKVTWSLVDGATGYELWRSTAPEDEASWTLVKNVKDGNTDRYTNQGLTEGVTYYYAVRAYAVDAEGQKVYSDFSNMDYMPAAVVWDAPYSNATFRIRLRWKEITGAHGYQIWRLNEEGEWKIVKTLGDKGDVLTDNQGATTAYSNTGLTSGDSYTYRIRAFMITEDGRKVFGAYSDAFTVAVMPEAPVATATSPKATRALVEWNEVNGAAGYQVWMQNTDSNAGWAIVKSVTDGSTTYTKYDLQSGTTYEFKVRAYTEVDGKKTFGAYSEIVSIKVK